MTVPSPAATIEGTTAWAQNTEPTRLLSYTLRRSSGVVVSSIRRGELWPALLTRTSTLPCLPSTSSTMPKTRCLSATSTP